jgi:hypothetical protein
MTRVTPFVSPADICDQGLLTLYLYFEGRNQCIFRLHDHVICFAMKIETDSELQLHFSIRRLPALGLNPGYTCTVILSPPHHHAVVLRANIRLSLRP